VGPGLVLDPRGRRVAILVSRGRMARLATGRFRKLLGVYLAVRFASAELCWTLGTELGYKAQGCSWAYSASWPCIKAAPGSSAAFARALRRCYAAVTPPAPARRTAVQLA